MTPQQEADFQLLCKSINKDYGKGTMQYLNESPEISPNDIIPTGSIELDTALGIGGYRKGRIIEIYGDASTGKSTMCLQAVANAQKKGEQCVYVDVEHTFDPQYAQNLGCDLSSLVVSQPDFGEQALEIVNKCARSGAVGLVVIDSVSALTPKAELEGEITDQSVGVQARMMSKAMRMITGNANKTGCTIIFVNQIRQKIGVMFGSNKTTSGGNALKFYATQRIELIRTGSEKEGNVPIGNITKAKVVKNKVAPPFKEAEFVIVWGKGIDENHELLSLAIQDGFIEKAGAWFRYNGESIAQGKISAINWLQENPEIRSQIKKEILEMRGLQAPEETIEDKQEEAEENTEE